IAGTRRSKARRSSPEASAITEAATSEGESERRVIPAQIRGRVGRSCVRLTGAQSSKGVDVPDASLTWLGHASFRFDTPGGKPVYVDPWLDNPKCPDAEKEPERIDVIAVTHGHSDHVGSAVELAKRFSPEIVAQVELKGWLGRQGAPVGDMPGPNKGGTVM